MRFDEIFLSLPPSPSSDRTGFVLDLAGTTFPDAKYKIRRDATHTLYVLEYVVSGRGRLRCGGREYTLQAGDVYLLQPQIEHEYSSDPGDPWEKLWFNWRGALPDALCDVYHLRGRFVFPKSFALEKEFRRGMDILRARRPDAYLELALTLHGILARLGEKPENADANNAPSSAGRKMRAYLQEHWRSEVQLAALARFIEKSPAQTVRIFRADWHCSPYALVQNLREKYARQYLENTDESVKKIADLCGFKDEFYFSNWFKHRTGSSPSAFRLRFRPSSGT